MFARRCRQSRAALGFVLLLGSYVGCFPDFDVLSGGGDDQGGGVAGTSGAMGGGADTGGAGVGDAGTSGEGGESTGGTGGTDSGGTGTGGKASGGEGGSSGGKGGKGGDGNSGEGGDAGDAGTTGNGGSAGAGGASGNGGGGVGGAGAGGAGAGGQAGGCTEPANVTASGVERLSVPLTIVGDGQRFNVHNRASPSMPYDLSGATVTVRAYAPCAVGGNLSIFFRSTSASESPSMKVALSTLVGGFVDIAVPVPAATETFDPVLVDVVRIEVEADAAYGYTFQSPATVVYIDSVVSSNGAVMHPFDSEPVNLDFQMSGARPLAGSSFSWHVQYP